MRIKLNQKAIQKHKKQVVSNYNAYKKWQSNKNYKVLPPNLGVVFSDCVLHFNTNGLIKFKGFRLYINETKKLIKI